ncbi:tumor necrosis factor receptor superfamily member 11B-like isoform X1 [Alosa sapidissima]|uniref:tumor necrosis factor receptor superfamily member 11B-like isoform X1 n=1 Tax=Alosa sapidissima TaxID=34773 RepID=UPI001C09A38C|nr:tumor necrosis factor receptor superfamily member 11B-like isoform X1 [Alosa sapidissima]
MRVQGGPIRYCTEPPHTLAPVVVCALLVSVTSEPHTFRHRDPMSRKMLICDRCPAGFYMKAPCTPNRQTICAPCPLNHFTQFHNYLPKCLYCSTFCSEHQVVKQECTAFNDRVCECQEGYYKRADFCVKHRDCPPGEGVKQRGSAMRNTVCDTCELGTFSPERSSTAVCVHHTDCAARGLRVALKGSQWHDNICMSCQEQRDQGPLAPLRRILSAFFSHEKLRLGKMRKLARVHMGLRVETKQPAGEERSPSSKRSGLLAAIDKWAKEQPEPRLRQLVNTLRGEMYNVGRELERKISEIDEQMKHCELENKIATQNQHQGTHMKDQRKNDIY